MCHRTCVEFGYRALKPSDILSKKILEVGAYQVNISLRRHMERMKPASYTGIDIMEGPGVDEVCSAENIIERFGKESFDVIICTEVLERV